MRGFSTKITSPPIPKNGIQANFPPKKFAGFHPPQSGVNYAMALHCPESMSPIAGFFNGLTLAKLEHLGDIYSPAVEFHSPLHQTRGLPALRLVYEQLFQQLQDVSVTVTDAHGDERTGFLLWEMCYQDCGKPRSITGTSHLKFARDGRVAAQLDHWDASSLVADEFPLLGWAVRGIKRLVKTKPKNGA